MTNVRYWSEHQEDKDNLNTPLSTYFKSLDDTYRREHIFSFIFRPLGIRFRVAKWLNFGVRVRVRLIAASAEQKFILQYLYLIIGN